jgi:hypothetical protein
VGRGVLDLYILDILFGVLGSQVWIDEVSPPDTVGRCDLCNIVDYIALCVFRSYRRYRL